MISQEQFGTFNADSKVKSYIFQVIRVYRDFTFNLQAATNPWPHYSSESDTSTEAIRFAQGLCLNEGVKAERETTKIEEKYKG